MVPHLLLCSPFPSICRFMLGIIRGMSSRKLKSLLLICLTETTLLIEAHKDHRARAETDVANLLRTGQTQRALLWVERVIKEQNMVDVLFTVQRILHILIEKALQIHTYKSCPNELREAVASLVYAAPRCGDCPELQKFCKLLQSWFMKHSFNIISEADQQMVHLLSTTQPSLERRLETMEVVAAIYGIRFNLKQTSLSEFD